MKRLFLNILAALLVPVMSGPAKALDTREFEVISQDQGSVSVTMGKYDFCALTTVLAGGFNSACIVQKQGDNWILTAHDPGKPDPWVGEGQHCRASCFSLKGVLVAEPPTTDSASYLGCYKDGYPQTRDLSGYTTNSSGMTTKACVGICRDRGFSYAATQYGQHCFCDNSYGKLGQASNCDMRCSGDSSETCGGNNANSVYSVKKVPYPVPQPTGAVRYLGCFRDGYPQARDLAAYTTNFAAMTTQACVSLCREKGFSYAATQYSQHCFCDNSYGRFGQAGNCDMKCGGDTSETCGGNNANSVYSIK